MSVLLLSFVFFFFGGVSAYHEQLRLTDFARGLCLALNLCSVSGANCWDDGVHEDFFFSISLYEFFHRYRASSDLARPVSSSAALVDALSSTLRVTLLLRSCSTIR